VKRTAAIAATLALLTLPGCGEATLDSKAVRNEAETIESLAEEGRIVADELERGELKVSFAQVHSADLAERAAREQKALEPSLATPKLQSTVTKLQSLAEDVSVQLRGIETDPREQKSLQEVVDQLDQLSGEASKIVEGL